jgi:hypothetical protein
MKIERHPHMCVCTTVQCPRIMSSGCVLFLQDPGDLTSWTSCNRFVCGYQYPGYLGIIQTTQKIKTKSSSYVYQKTNVVYLVSLKASPINYIHSELEQNANTPLSCL